MQSWMLMCQAPLSAACSRPYAWAGLQVCLSSALSNWTALTHACLLTWIICMTCLHYGSCMNYVSSLTHALLLLAGVEAQLMVPRALKVLESSNSAQQAWLGAWGSTPLHVLLPWAAQMLSLLGSPEGAALLPVLKVSTEPKFHHCFTPAALPVVISRCQTEL